MHDESAAQLAADRLDGPNGQLGNHGKRIVELALTEDAVTRMYIVRCAREQAGQPEDEEVLACVNALHKAREHHDGEISAPKFQAWLNGQRRPHPYPSIAKVCAVLGGEGGRWSVACQRAFALPDADPTASRVVARMTIRVGPELLKAHVREWANEPERAGGPFRLGDFVAWSREKAETTGTFDDPYPLSAVDLYEHFDGWFHLLDAAGVSPCSTPDSGLFVDGVRVERIDPRVREMARAAHRMAAEGTPLTRKRLLASFKELTGDDAVALKQGMSPPTFTEVCGDFREFLHAAGLAGARTGMEQALGLEVDTRTDTRTDGEDYTDEEIEAFLRFCVSKDGSRIGKAQICRRRDREIRKAARAGHVLRLPTEYAIRGRFGSIPMALAHIGAITHAEALRRTKPEYTREDRLDALEAAIRHCGSQLGVCTYARYADKRRADSPIRRFPSGPAVALIDEAGRKFEIAREITIRERNLHDVPPFITDLRSSNEH